MSRTEKFEIKNRFTGAVIFTCEVDAPFSTEGLKLGAAVKLADLADADLAGASLAGADLARTNLAGTYFAGADLAGAKGLLDCGTPHGYRVVVNMFQGSVRIWAGCRSLTMAEALKHWKKRSDRKLMLPLLAYVRAAAKINGWTLTAKKVKP